MTGRYPATVGITDFTPGHWRPWENLVVPKKADELRARLAAWRKSAGAKMPTVNLDYNAAKAHQWQRRVRGKQKCPDASARYSGRRFFERSRLSPTLRVIACILFQRTAQP